MLYATFLEERDNRKSEIQLGIKTSCPSWELKIRDSAERIENSGPSWEAKLWDPELGTKPEAVAVDSECICSGNVPVQSSYQGLQLHSLGISAERERERERENQLDSAKVNR